MFGRKRIFHQVFQLVAHLGNVQADDDLNPVAAAYYPVGAQRFKDVVTLRFRHIDQRDAQSGGELLMLSMLSAPPRACRKPAA